MAESGENRELTTPNAALRMQSACRACYLYKAVATLSNSLAQSRIRRRVL